MHAQNGLKIALPKQSSCTIRYNTYQVPRKLLVSDFIFYGLIIIIIIIIIIIYAY